MRLNQWEIISLDKETLIEIIAQRLTIIKPHADSWVDIVPEVVATPLFEDNELNVRINSEIDDGKVVILINDF